MTELKRAITKKDMIAMNRTSSSIKGVLDSVRTQLQILDASIKADQKSKAEFERLLTSLRNRKADLEQRIIDNNKWAETYDRDVGPFAQRYKQMTGDIGDLYENAKKGHARGIVLLQNEFGYHPAFKRPQDTFTAVPFRPI
jgi:hypothetical protein